MTGQPIYDFGGNGPVINLALANGFPPQTYQPLLGPLTNRYRVVSLPPRALWPGIGPAPEQAGSWRELADDLLAGLAQYDLRDVIAIGHSFGAVAALLAVLDQPTRFRALIMLDPTILPPPLMNAFKDMRLRGEEPRLPLVDGALKRKHRFPDLDGAYTYWRGKPLFRDWSDEALRLYAESMTRPAAAGDGLELAWPRDWEAYYYLSIYTNIWDDLPRLDGLLPVLIVQGGDSDTYTSEAADLMKATLPAATHVTLPGYGHLFPQAAPDQTRTIIEQWLATSGTA